MERRMKRNHWNALSIRKLVSRPLFFLEKTLFHRRHSPLRALWSLSPIAWAYCQGINYIIVKQDDEFLCNSVSLISLLLCCRHSQLDGNAVTMLPFPGGETDSSPFNDTSAHFLLSTAKIQCHVQSLFINRNEMLALRCSTVSVLNGAKAARWKCNGRRKTENHSCDERWWCHLARWGEDERWYRYHESFSWFTQSRLKVILWFLV